MKKLLLVLTVVFMSNLVMSQEVIKQKEVGLVLYDLGNLSNFGMTYKTGNNHAMWRFTTLFAGGSNSEQTVDSITGSNSNLGFGVKFGREYRKEIANNFEFRYGADISYSFSYTTSKNAYMTYRDASNEQTTHKPGLNLVFGFNYVIKQHFVIGLEMLPYASYIYSKRKDGLNTPDELTTKTTGFSWGLSNNSVLVSLSYRF